MAKVQAAKPKSSFFGDLFKKSPKAKTASRPGASPASTTLTNIPAAEGPVTRPSAATRTDSGEIAIERAKSEQPDLILMDVVMPGLNGFQATRAITREEKTKHIPVIICTTKDQETDKIWGLRQGAKDYVTKPLSENDLLEKIKALG